ncbi:MAG: hypothetical protein Q9159_003983 [Coniocarpon cinnabarinum]
MSRRSAPPNHSATENFNSNVRHPILHALDSTRRIIQDLEAQVRAANLRTTALEHDVGMFRFYLQERGVDAHDLRARYDASTLRDMRASDQQTTNTGGSISIVPQHQGNAVPQSQTRTDQPGNSAATPAANNASPSIPSGRNAASNSEGANPPANTTAPSAHAHGTLEEQDAHRPPPSSANRSAQGAAPSQSGHRPPTEESHHRSKIYRPKRSTTGPSQRSASPSDRFIQQGRYREGSPPRYPRARSIGTRLDLESLQRTRGAAQHLFALQPPFSQDGVSSVPPRSRKDRALDTLRYNPTADPHRNLDATAQPLQGTAEQEDEEQGSGDSAPLGEFRASSTRRSRVNIFSETEGVQDATEGDGANAQSLDDRETVAQSIPSLGNPVTANGSNDHSLRPALPYESVAGNSQLSQAAQHLQASNELDHVVDTTGDPSLLDDAAAGETTSSRALSSSGAEENIDAPAVTSATADTMRDDAGEVQKAMESNSQPAKSVRWLDQQQPAQQPGAANDSAFEDEQGATIGPINPSQAPNSTATAAASRSVLAGRFDSNSDSDSDDSAEASPVQTTKAHSQVTGLTALGRTILNLHQHGRTENQRVTPGQTRIAEAYGQSLVQVRKEARAARSVSAAPAGTTPSASLPKPVVLPPATQVVAPSAALQSALQAPPASTDPSTLAVDSVQDRSSTAGEYMPPERAQRPITEVSYSDDDDPEPAAPQPAPQAPSVSGATSAHSTGPTQDRSSTAGDNMPPERAKRSISEVSYSNGDHPEPVPKRRRMR